MVRVTRCHMVLLTFHGLQYSHIPEYFRVDSCEDKGAESIAAEKRGFLNFSSSFHYNHNKRHLTKNQVKAIREGKIRRDEWLVIDGGSGEDMVP